MSRLSNVTANVIAQRQRAAGTVGGERFSVTESDMWAPSGRADLLAAARRSEPRAVQARNFEVANKEAQVAAAQARDARDALVRELFAEDPRLWTHRGLAKMVGCSPELIAVILRNGKNK